MKPLIALITVALFVNVAQANDANCIAKADQALAKVAQTLGLGKGVGHLGGSEITKKTTDNAGNEILTVGGGVLAASDTDGYLTGTGAIFEMIQTKNGCLVNGVSISTGADFQASAE